MADNVPITAGAGTNIATDDVGSVHFQKIKLDAGGDGASVPVIAGQQTMAASVPVVIASNQSAVPVSDGSGSLTVDGPLTDAELRVADVKVTLDSESVAVTGTFWQATQPVSAAALPLPTGAATAALQGGGLPAALGAGGGVKVDGSGTALPVSGTVAVTNADLTTLAGAVDGGHMQVDVLSGASGATAVSVDVTLSMTAEAHHAGDVLAATQEVASVARANGTGVELVSMVVRDADDQTASATTFYFLDANSALGTEGSAPDIDDTEVQDICGMVVVPAAAWIDLGTSKIASMSNLGLLMHPGAASTSLYIAATTAGTPTPSATGMTVTLQFIRY